MDQMGAFDASNARFNLSTDGIEYTLGDFIIRVSSIGRHGTIHTMIIVEVRLQGPPVFYMCLFYTRVHSLPFLTFSPYRLSFGLILVFERLNIKRALFQKSAVHFSIR
jgi:hypothetical protein